MSEDQNTSASDQLPASEELGRDAGSVAGVYPSGMRLFALAAISLILAVPAAASGSPVVRVRTTPFTVTGVGFRSHEVVRIVVDTTSHYAAMTTASSTGTFSVRMAAIRVARCSSYVVHVTGSLGSKAMLKYRPPECSPQ